MELQRNFPLLGHEVAANEAPGRLDLSHRVNTLGAPT